MHKKHGLEMSKFIYCAVPLGEKYIIVKQYKKTRFTFGYGILFYIL